MWLNRKKRKYHDPSTRSTSNIENLCTSFEIDYGVYFLDNISFGSIKVNSLKMVAVLLTLFFYPSNSAFNAKCCWPEGAFQNNSPAVWHLMNLLRPVGPFLRRRSVTSKLIQWSCEICDHSEQRSLLMLNQVMKWRIRWMKPSVWKVFWDSWGVSWWKRSHSCCCCCCCWLCPSWTTTCFPCFLLLRMCIKRRAQLLLVSMKLFKKEWGLTEQEKRSGSGAERKETQDSERKNRGEPIFRMESSTYYTVNAKESVSRCHICTTICSSFWLHIQSVVIARECGKL